MAKAGTNFSITSTTCGVRIEMVLQTTTNRGILFVGDPTDLDPLITDLLTDAELNYEIAGNAFNGIKQIEDAPFDCVISPVTRSDIAPDQLVDLIRETDRTIPIVFIGEADDPERVIHTVGTQSVSYVRDPTAERRVLDTVRRAIASRRLQAGQDRYVRLKSSILELALTLDTATGQEEIESIVHTHWNSTSLFKFAWFGEFDPEPAGLVLHGPVSGRFGADEIDSLVGGDDTGLLERAVGGRETVVSRGQSQMRSTTTTRASGPVDQRGIPHDHSKNRQTVAVIPIYHEQTTYAVLVLLTDAYVDTTEQRLLDAIARFIGHRIWLVGGDREHNGELSDRLHGYVDLFSHEIRNPLANALSQLELAIEQDDPEALEVVRTNLHRIDTILSTFTTVTRQEAVSDTTDRNLADTATAAWDAIEHAESELFISDSRPLSANHDLLERLFSNLMRNAIQFAGPDVTIRIGIMEDGFFVEDDGPGIRPDERERIFEWGYSTHESGMGIGLSFVREITNVHNWEISVTTSELGGVRFEITGIDWSSRSETEAPSNPSADAGDQQGSNNDSISDLFGPD